MTRRIAFAAAAVAVLAAGPAWAQQAPHVHGVGELKIAVEGDTLYVIWESPLANLVGFEHAPKTAEEKAATKRAEDAVRDFTRLFRTPPAAGCALKAVAIESSGEHTADHAHGRGHDANEKKHAHEKEHDKKHAHDEKGDHDKKHAPEKEHDKKHAAETHSELSALYNVACRDIKALDHIEVMVFDAFPGTETLKAEIVTAAGQSAVTLTAKSRRVGLK